MSLDLGPADALVSRHPLARVRTGRGIVSYRAAGTGPALCLLHGIGSQSGSWVRQLEALVPSYRVIAWDAPGYGESDRLDAESPDAAEYAASLAALLDALRIDRAVLVASSLGALMAGAFAAHLPERAAGLVLLNPAGGYGLAAAQERDEKLAARLARLAELGPEGMARALPAGMLSPGASAEARALAQWSTARIRPEGYAQAARMLAHGRLIEDAAKYAGPVQVVAGSLDDITPPAGCERIAQAFPRGAYRLLTDVGHLSYLDAPATVDAIVAEFAARRARGAAA
ncbi:MAG TPA: alpha/beta fold hydrolase [Burkholderiales bacterium]|nr:alpha/beta fold hydrolase [Burkholderiales bacterium]